MAAPEDDDPPLCGVFVMSDEQDTKEDREEFWASRYSEELINLTSVWPKLTSYEIESIVTAWKNHGHSPDIATLPFRSAQQTWCYLWDYSFNHHLSKPQRKYFTRLRRKIHNANPWSLVRRTDIKTEGNSRGDMELLDGE